MDRSITTTEFMEKLSDYQKKLMTHVKYTQYCKMGKKTTVCILIMNNGFEVVGTSACIDPANFDANLGMWFSLIEALNNLDKFVGFYEQEKKYIENMNK